MSNEEKFDLEVLDKIGDLANGIENLRLEVQELNAKIPDPEFSDTGSSVAESIDNLKNDLIEGLGYISSKTPGDGLIAINAVLLGLILWRVW